MKIIHFDGRTPVGREIDMPVNLGWPNMEWQLVQADPYYTLYWRHRKTGYLVPQAGYSDVAKKETRHLMKEYELRLVS